jgi:hypothetical protein
MYSVDSGFGWDCSTLGAPPGGVTTGPSVTMIPQAASGPNGPQGLFATFVFVRNGNSFYEKHLQDQGDGWTNWSTSMVGPPPSGVTPNSAIVASHGNAAISVAFRDTNNKVWMKVAPAGANLALPVFGPWIQVAKDGNGTTSAPSPALDNSNKYVFALGPGGNIRFNTCGSPCFTNPWANVPNFTQTFNEGVQTLAENNPYTDDETWLYMVATHQGNVYFDTMDMTTGQEFGSGIFSSPQGKAADSAPAVVYYFSSDRNGPLLVVHMNDGHWWTYDTNIGGAWHQLPAVP